MLFLQILVIVTYSLPLAKLVDSFVRAHTEPTPWLGLKYDDLMRAIGVALVNVCSNLTFSAIFGSNGMPLIPYYDSTWFLILCRITYTAPAILVWSVFDKHRTEHPDAIDNQTINLFLWWNLLIYFAMLCNLT